MAKLLYEVKEGIGWIRFNDPEILNAVNSEGLQTFVDTLRKAADDDYGATITAFGENRPPIFKGR